MRLKPVQNPPNPYESTVVEWLEEPPKASLQIYEEEAKSILQHNDSPDIGFCYSLNPYRGCTHACAYCYARNSHRYWGFGAGTDFDSKIIVKTNAVQLLERTVRSPSWKRDTIVFSGNTDCYQPIEAAYNLTRQCLEVCLLYQIKVHIITKSALIRRDIDLLSKMQARSGASVTISIPFLDADDARAIEPYASSPETRFESVRRLAEAGIPVGVNVAPIIPGLNDIALVQILERSKRAGASFASMQALRLADDVEAVFFERLENAFPNKVTKVKQALLQIRNGRIQERAFHARMRGEGPRWHIVEQLFHQTMSRLGLDCMWVSSEEKKKTDRPPTNEVTSNSQLSLFTGQIPAKPHARQK